MPTNERDIILDLIQKFIESRPGFEFANYGDAASYRADYRSSLSDLHDARQLLAAVRWHGISAEALKTALAGAFSGRLSYKDGRLDYCVGQYYPTEYRAAACAVLASALWAYFREQPGNDTGPAIRYRARQDFGKGITRRWFN